MIKVYLYSCLLSALCIVGMKTLNLSGRVGQNVTVTCSGWNTLFDVTSNVKYLCKSPCSSHKDVILKAGFKKTARKNRIELTNSAEGLFVTFTNLQKSDGKKYQCRVERFGYDSYIEVNLQVTDAEPSRPKTTPKAVTDASILSLTVTNSSSSSSNGLNIITDPSTAHIIHSTMAPSASATQGAGRVLYLIIGVITIVAILLFLLIVMRRMMKNQSNVVSSAGVPQEHAHEDVEYDEIRLADQHTEAQPSVLSSVCYCTTDTDADVLCANYSTHQDAASAAERGDDLSESLYMNPTPHAGVKSKEACAKSRVTHPPCDVYSLIKQPKEQIKPTGPSEPSLSESRENDFIYSLAQL